LGRRLIFMSEDKKLAVLGLDGATWSVIDPLINKGYMPNMKEIHSNGASGKLRSTFPPITAPAWMSMATGKNPGKTGISDFFKNDKNDDFDPQTVNSFDFRENGTYWDYLNENGYVTYLIGYPMLYPYYSIDGIMIGGWGTPDGSKIAYPEYANKRLNNLTKEYVTHIPWRAEKYNNNKELFLKDLIEMLESQHLVIENFLKDNWNLFVYVCSVSDFLLHVMWEDWDNSESSYHSKFINVWKKIDDLIGTFLERKEMTLFIVSDHGFGSVNNKFSPATWLLKNGYAKKKRFYKIKSATKSILTKINNLLKKFSFYEKIGIDHSTIKNIFLSENVKKSLNVSLPIPSEIDLNNSSVVSVSNGISGSFFIINENGESKNLLKNEIIKKMKLFSQEKGFDIEIFKRENIYEGENVNKNADILFKVDNYECFIKSDYINSAIYKKNYNFQSRSGSHRRNGIFLGYGKDIKGINLRETIEIFDIAPTILQFFNVPIPNDMDGEVHKEIFTEYSDAYQKEIKYSKEDEKDKLKEAIQGLKM